MMLRPFLAGAAILALASVANANLVMLPTGGGGGGGYVGPVLDAGSANAVATAGLTGGSGPFLPCATSGGGGSGITTSGPNEDIFIVGVHELNITSPAPTMGVTSGDGLTWVLLATPGAGHNAIKTDSMSSTGMFQTMEIWWARAAVADNYNPSFSLTQNSDAGAYVCFAVSNGHATVPQDANASIAASGAGAASAHPTVTGISTTGTNTLLISAASTASPTVDCPGVGASAPSGFTEISSKNVVTASVNFLCLDVAYKQASTTQSGAAVTWANASTWPNWLSLVTAIVPP